MSVRASDEYGTPKWLLSLTWKIFGYHNLDVAASLENTVLAHYLNIGADGLKRDWANQSWCNPPHSNPKPWVEKAIIQASLHGVRSTLLLPTDTSTEWYHLCRQHGHAYHLSQRVRFVGATQGVKFGSMLCRFGPHTLDNAGTFYIDTKGIKK